RSSVVQKYLMPENEHQVDEASNPDWFRAPTVRERRIGAALFIGFRVFFLTLFVVLSGWWFRWVILMLGGYSILVGIRHLLGRNANAESAEAQRAQRKE